MKKILLALNSEIMAEALQDRLRGAFDVVYCLNSEDALDLLGAYRPDVLVLDLMLGGMDSIGILQAARDTATCSKTVALSNYIGPYTAEMMEVLQVCHLEKTSCDIGQIAGRITDIALWEPDTERIRQSIRNTLLNLSFKMNTENYRIIECAITEFFKDPSQPLTAQLYPTVARLCNGTATQVEKAIRTGVESAFKNGNESMWRLYFAAGKNGKVSKPTNGDFLARMAMCLNENIEKKGERKVI